MSSSAAAEPRVPGSNTEANAEANAEAKAEAKVALGLCVLNAGLAMGTDFAALAESPGGAMPVMKRLMDVNYLVSVCE